MGANRTSNKDVLDAIERLTQVIQSSMASNQAQVPATPSANSTPSNGELDIDGHYLTHMRSKVAGFAKEKGEDCVLYLRRNQAGEKKLAFCVASKWSNLKDRGLIGAIEIVEA